ncbi:hypothetical protein D3C84_1036320 [compost metagenome]
MVVDGGMLEAAAAGQVGVPDVQALVARQLHLDEAEAVQADGFAHRVVNGAHAAALARWVVASNCMSRSK